MREGYKNTELGEIPVEWEVRKMKDIIERTQLGTNTLGKENNNGIPMLKMGNLIRGGFSFGKVEKIDESEVKMNEEYILKKGDFLFNTRNTLELVGKSATWNNQLTKAIFNSNIMRIKFKNEIDDFYMSYYFEGNIGWKQLKRISTGTTSVAAIYTKDLHMAKVIVPSYKEQKKISDILYTVDIQIDQTDKLIQKTKELKKGLMQKLLTKGIGRRKFKETEVGEIPVDWEVKSMGEISTFINGRAYKRSEFKNEGTPIIRIQNLTGKGNYVYSDLSLDEDKYIEYGDLIYAWSATFGPFIWKGERGIYHYHIWKILCNESMLDKQFYYFRLNYISSEMDNKKSGSAFSHITKTFMESHTIAVPPLEEQKQIANILSTVDEKIQQYEDKKEKLQEIKKGLIQQLLTGKIRVKV